jgi:hypothetical protein
MILFVFLIISINKMQRHAPKYMPNVLRTWDFLPSFMKSLKPYDEWIEKYLLCFKFCQKVIVRKSSLIEADKFEKKIERRFTLAIDNKAYVDVYAF